MGEVGYLFVVQGCAGRARASLHLLCSRCRCHCCQTAGASCFAMLEAARSNHGNQKVIAQQQPSHVKRCYAQSMATNSPPSVYRSPHSLPSVGIIRGQTRARFFNGPVGGVQGCQCQPGRRTGTDGAVAKRPFLHADNVRAGGLQQRYVGGGRRAGILARSGEKVGRARRR